jgi:tryptophan-rich sensory protein
MNFLGRWQSLIISCILSIAFASAGALLTNLDEWYFNLKQPSWKPPDEAFGLIWSTIFAFCAAAAWLSWNSVRNHEKRMLLLILFLINGVLNVLWSVLYFQMHRPDWSFLECFALLVSILSLIWVQWRASKTASLLIVPYLIWVSTATVLNWQTVVLNGF